MKFALKKLKIYEEASEKSVCFHADFWVDDMCIAEVKNLGEGKPHIWKTVTYYQKFKPEFIKAKLGNARLACDLDSWVDSVIKEARQRYALQKTLKEDEKVEINFITGEPEVVKKPKEPVWKPKQSKMAKTAKEKPDYSKIPWQELEHKGAKHKVQLIGETLSHGKLYNKYQTKEGKIIHQKKVDGKPAAKAAPTKTKAKPKVDISDL